LPVVVEVLANRMSTICIEQPEIHIHPRLQGDVADLLLEAASLRDNQLIVETHSEHLILRLLRRLKEGRNKWLTPDKISVIYVGSDEFGRAEPTQIRVGARGDFEDEWPGGFFDERYEDLFVVDQAPIPLPGLPLPRPKS
jgi:predicted ATPase